MRGNLHLELQVQWAGDILSYCQKICVTLDKSISSYNAPFIKVKLTSEEKIQNIINKNKIISFLFLFFSFGALMFN